MSESVEAKANKYLIEGRVGVGMCDAQGKAALAYVIGSEEYTVGFLNTIGWSCTCPAQTECAHIVACKKIMPHLQIDSHPTLGNPDNELTDFLDSFK